MVEHSPEKRGNNFTAENVNQRSYVTKDASSIVNVAEVIVSLFGRKRNGAHELVLNLDGPIHQKLRKVR